MDKEQARFILRSFRPDGADAGDPDFAEALKLAAESRELGEWLAGERAFDGEFANALGTLDLPANLREDIMACLAAERGDYPQAMDADDAAWIGAIASIQPPDSLRAEILAAMDRTVMNDITPVVKISMFRRVAIPLAAAAGIALAFFITRPERASSGIASQAVPIDAVQAGFVKAYESPFFALEKKREDHQLLVQHLVEKKLPCPSCLPPGLARVKAVGCRELSIDGKRGSVICFLAGEKGLVHMVIFRREDVRGYLPAMEQPDFVQEGKWAAARWQDDENVYLLMGDTHATRMSELF